jgi:uncharacterized membrane protein
LLFFAAFAAAWSGTVSWDEMLLILTTIVSLEAIYLAIFIQMSVNLASASLREVSEDVAEVQEDVGELHEHVEEISEDVEEIQEDIDEIQEDVEDISEEDAKDEAKESAQEKTLADIQMHLRKLLEDVDRLKRG